MANSVDLGAANRCWGLYIAYEGALLNPAGGAHRKNYPNNLQNYPNNPQNYPNKPRWMWIGGQSAAIRYQWEGWIDSAGGINTPKSTVNPSAGASCFVKSTAKKALIIRQMAQNLAHTWTNRRRFTEQSHSRRLWVWICGVQWKFKCSPWTPIIGKADFWESPRILYTIGSYTWRKFLGNLFCAICFMLRGLLLYPNPLPHNGILHSVVCKKLTIQYLVHDSL